MTWIKTISPNPPDDENADLRAALASQRVLYPEEYGAPPREDSRLSPIVANDSIVLSHSLIPAALGHAFSTFGALMNPDLPLERRQHEMIAATVSAVNRCRY